MGILDSGTTFNNQSIYPSVIKTSSSSSSSGYANYPKMFSSAVKFRDIQDRVLLDLGLTMYDSLPELIGNDVEKGMKYFKDIIERSIRLYSQTHPEKMEINIMSTTSKYQFVDNFQDYLDGKITEEEIVLVPIGTPFHKSSTTFSNAKSWHYKKPFLIATEYAGMLPQGTYGYYAAAPYKIEIASDNNFTEDSILYSTDDTRSDEAFMCYLNLEVAKRLRRMINSLSIGGNIDVLPHLDLAIQELEVEKDRYNRIASAHLSYMWRK